MMALEHNSAMSYANLFDKILAKPAMYVGNCRIERIGAYMDGYIYAKWEAGDLREDDPYFGFNGWVARRFRIKTAHNWVGIIQFMSGSEASAFEMTVELWDEYKAAGVKSSQRKRRAPDRAQPDNGMHPTADTKGLK